MTLSVQIASLVAAAVVRDLAPPNRSLTRTAATALFKVVGRGWQDRKALAVLPNPVRRRRRRRPAGPVEMYDAVNVANIPSTAQAVAGYMNGRWITVPALKKRFRRLWRRLRRPRLVTIAVTAEELDADYLDVENGDATPEQAPGWVKAKLGRRDDRPGLYANRSTWPKLWKLLAAAGIKRDQIRIWVADWTNEPHCPTWANGCQWRGGATAAYDVSLCLPSFF